jgi:hypothetical protein
VDPGKVVAVRIQGTLRHGADPDMDVELFHPGCAPAGELSFEHIDDRDDHVLALELDWADPHECPVCEVSIT